MYMINIVKAIKKLSINEIINFIFENYYKRIAFFMENSYCSVKHLKKKIIVARKQINRKKYLILAMLKNTINYS